MVSSTSLVIDRVMRPLRRPWLLAVRRPLKATVGSLSSASSPEVSSLLKHHNDPIVQTQCPVFEPDYRWVARHDVISGASLALAFDTDF